MSPAQEELLPGASLRVDGDEQRVESVFRCSEGTGDARAAWTWAFLDDGSLLELAPRGAFRYRRHRVLAPRSTLFQQLLAADGAVLRFEARVRAGRAEAEPTVLTIDGREYRLRATGTARAAREGPAPELGGWNSLAADERENVYFLLEAREGAEVALGLWTRGACLSFGLPAMLG